MSIRKGITLLLFTCGTLGYSGLSQANCWRVLTTPTVQLDMNVGRVIVSPDANIGDILLEKTYTMSEGSVNYRCDKPTEVKFKADLVNPGPLVGNHVYATNVKGIGIKFNRGGVKKVDYPGIITSTGAKFFLAGSTFTITLVKTANETGSGVIKSGQYTTYGADDGSPPILETYVSINGITIVSPSCKLISDKVMNITMPDVSVKDFKGIDTTVGSKDFSIDLQCNGGVSFTGYADIGASFSGETPTGYQKSTGVLVNENTEGNSATGVGFQILSKGKPITFDKKYTIGRLENTEERRLSFPMSVSYYQYGKTAEAGRVKSHMVYNINYD